VRKEGQTRGNRDWKTGGTKESRGKKKREEGGQKRKGEVVQTFIF
jgi:hypothetical protein